MFHETHTTIETNAPLDLRSPLESTYFHMDKNPLSDSHSPKLSTTTIHVPKIEKEDDVYSGCQKVDVPYSKEIILDTFDEKGIGMIIYDYLDDEQDYSECSDVDVIYDAYKEVVYHICDSNNPPETDKDIDAYKDDVKQFLFNTLEIHNEIWVEITKLKFKIKYLPNKEDRVWKPSSILKSHDYLVIADNEAHQYGDDLLQEFFL